MGEMPNVIHSSWYPFLEPIFRDDQSLKLILNHIISKNNFYPEKKNIFRVFSMPMDQIKVVILGQDPYPQPNQAIGYAFAVSESTPKPFSLRAIEREVGHEIDKTMASWIDQGVFLLNTALTVEKGNAGSHLSFWEGFAKKIIKLIAYEIEPIWIMWGAKASKFHSVILNGEKVLGTNKVLFAPHPAAEAYAGGNAGFYGCDHFNKVNVLLTQANKQVINW